MIYNNVTWAVNWREMQDKITELNNKGFRIVQILEDTKMQYVILYEKYVDVEKEFNIKLKNQDELIENLKNQIKKSLKNV